MLLTHAKNYSDLMVEGLQHALQAWKLRVLMFSLAGVALVLGLLSGLFALLLWGALPELNSDRAWLLLATPTALGLTSLLCYLAGKSVRPEPLFNDVIEQLELDQLAICQAMSR